MRIHFSNIALVSAVSLLVGTAQLFATKAVPGGRISTSSSTKATINARDPQLDKARVNLKDKIEGTIEAIYNRINWLKSSNDSRRSSKFGSTDDELKSLTLSIKADIDKAKEDINNAMNNGEIFLSERDSYIQKIDRYKIMLKEMRIVDPEDLDKN